MTPDEVKAKLEAIIADLEKIDGSVVGPEVYGNVVVARDQLLNALCGVEGQLEDIE